MCHGLLNSNGQSKDNTAGRQDWKSSLKIIMPFASLYHVVSFPVGEQFLKPVGPRMSTAVHGFLYVEVSNQGLVAKIKLAKSPPRGAGLGLGMVAVMIQQVFYGIPMYSNVIIPHDSTEHNMFDIVRLFKHVQRMFKGCSEDVQRMFKHVFWLLLHIFS